MASKKKTPVCSRSDLRAALAHLHSISEKARQRDGYYRVDRHSIAAYFDLRNSWMRQLRSYLESLTNDKERIVCVDVCGRATGCRWGADHSYTYSLQPLGAFTGSANESHVRGDLFNGREFGAFIKTIAANGERPAVVAFEPLAGLEAYIPFESADLPALYPRVVYQLLEKHLREMVKIVRVGGFLYIGPPFQFLNIGDFLCKKPQNEYDLSLKMKKVARRLNCRIQI
jgi:hypothetical protein